MTEYDFDENIKQLSSRQYARELKYFYSFWFAMVGFASSIFLMIIVIGDSITISPIWMIIILVLGVLLGGIIGYLYAPKGQFSELREEIKRKESFKKAVKEAK